MDVTEVQNRKKSTGISMGVRYFDMLDALCRKYRRNRGKQIEWMTEREWKRSQRSDKRISRKTKSATPQEQQ